MNSVIIGIIYFILFFLSEAGGLNRRDVKGLALVLTFNWFMTMWPVWSRGRSLYSASRVNHRGLASTWTLSLFSTAGTWLGLGRLNDTGRTPPYLTNNSKSSRLFISHEWLKNRRWPQYDRYPIMTSLPNPLQPRYNIETIWNWSLFW